MDKGYSGCSVDGERCVELGRYIVYSGATVRAAAREFGVSKSPVHKEVTVHLREIDGGLYCEVREILEKNKAERHLRGGEATRLRYQRRRNGSSDGERLRYCCGDGGKG